MIYLTELLNSFGHTGSPGAVKEPQCTSCPVRHAMAEVATKILLHALVIPRYVGGISLKLILGGKWLCRVVTFDFFGPYQVP